MSASLEETFTVSAWGASPAIRNGSPFGSTRWRPLALFLSRSGGALVTVTATGLVVRVRPQPLRNTAVKVWLPGVVVVVFQRKLNGAAPSSAPRFAPSS